MTTYGPEAPFGHCMQPQAHRGTKVPGARWRVIITMGDRQAIRLLCAPCAKRWRLIEGLGDDIDIAVERLFERVPRERQLSVEMQAWPERPSCALTHPRTIVMATHRVRVTMGGSTREFLACQGHARYWRGQGAEMEQLYPVGQSTKSSRDEALIAFMERPERPTMEAAGVRFGITKQRVHQLLRHAGYDHKARPARPKTPKTETCTVCGRQYEAGSYRRHRIEARHSLWANRPEPAYVAEAIAILEARPGILYGELAELVGVHERTLVAALRVRGYRRYSPQRATAQFLGAGGDLKGYTSLRARDAAMLARHDAGAPLEELAAEFGLRPSTVSYAIRRVRAELERQAAP